MRTCQVCISEVDDDFDQQHETSADRNILFASVFQASDQLIVISSLPG